ncbi:MAG: glucose-6-phosphate isomerase [Lentisphaerae bacterium]|nr:glucose-6-phosphate isomerase [Lentisphaerota bacterium]MBR4884645.1 glucose-6-phosphate isomerase [Lentisphaeria bacterium]
MQSRIWIDRCHKYTFIDGESAFQVNFAGMNFAEEELAALEGRFENVHAEMQKIEIGEIKNPDENRKVTHFTDRSVYTGSEIFAEVEEFVEGVRSGAITGSTGEKFEYAIINGIGGSALGPQLVQMAINGPYWNELTDAQRRGYLKIYFLDNTDTAGAVDALAVCDLKKTLVVNISKSGGTQETKNNMIDCMNAYAAAGLDFAKHSCAITMKNSELDRLARSSNWLRTFEMAESIGGRTSVTSIVGHLPAALAGVNFSTFLQGACHMDTLTRNPHLSHNPAYMLAAVWYMAGNGKGDKNMAIVPYSDRLILMSRYLQQLVMESLGKELDLDGNVVHQGLNVFGNKGGTDAHAFIQQLNDGRNDFFITFIEVLRDKARVDIAPGVGMGDYLHGFMTGLSNALRSKGRNVIEMRIDDVNEFNLGMLIAIYERAVAAYAELIHINAFHQPGVQAYKLASKNVIKLLTDLEEKLAGLDGFSGTVSEFAVELGLQESEYEVDGILAKLAANNDLRDLAFTLKRTWNKDRGWVYSVAKK